MIYLYFRPSHLSFFFTYNQGWKEYPLLMCAKSHYLSVPFCTNYYSPHSQQWENLTRQIHEWLIMNLLTNDCHVCFLKILWRGFFMGSFLLPNNFFALLQIIPKRSVTNKITKTLIRKSRSFLYTFSADNKF